MVDLEGVIISAIVEHHAAIIFVGEEAIARGAKPVDLVDGEDRQRDCRATSQIGSYDAAREPQVRFSPLYAG